MRNSAQLSALADGRMRYASYGVGAELETILSSLVGGEGGVGGVQGSAESNY